MKQWNEQVVTEFVHWVSEKGGEVILPVKELMNGYEFTIKPPEGQTAISLINEYDKKVLNGRNKSG